MKYLFYKIVMLGTLLFPGVLAARTHTQLPTIDVSTKEKLIRVLNNVIDFLFTAGSVLAVIMLIWAGVLFMTGNEENITTARKILLYVVIGIVVIMFSYSVTGFLESVLRNT